MPSIPRSPVPTRRKVSALPSADAPRRENSASFSSREDRNAVARKSKEGSENSDRPVSEENVDDVGIENSDGKAGDCDVQMLESTDNCSGPSHQGMDKRMSPLKHVGRLDSSVYKKWEDDSDSAPMSRSSSDTSSEGAICGGGPGKRTCGEPVQAGDAGVLCDRCHNWFHPSCQGIPKPAMRALERYESLSWLCVTCKSELKTRKSPLALLATKFEELDKTMKSSMLEVQNSMKSQHDLLTSQLEELRRKEESTTQLVNQSAQLVSQTIKENTKQRTSYADVVKDSCAEVVQKVSEQISSLPHASTATGTNKSVEALTGALDDYMDKERRKGNVVVHNLPEQEGDSLVEKANKDATLFKEMIREEMKLNVNVQKSFRVGKKIPGKPRLLIISLELPSAKQDILRMAPLLRHSERYVNIYITPDLTRKERDASKKLREELASRKRAGETNLTIRAGKIVCLSSASATPQHASRTHKPTTQPQAAAVRASRAKDGGLETAITRDDNGQQSSNDQPPAVSSKRPSISVASDQH